MPEEYFTNYLMLLHPSVLQTFLSDSVSLIICTQSVHDNNHLTLHCFLFPQFHILLVSLILLYLCSNVYVPTGINKAPLIKNGVFWQGGKKGLTFACIYAMILWGYYQHID